jgi:hypothetical protein
MLSPCLLYPLGLNDLGCGMIPKDGAEMRSMNRSLGLYLAGILVVFLSFWFSFNALRQTRLALPGETPGQALRAILFGRPVLKWQLCSEEVHASYSITGPDGLDYPTWHPPVDMQNRCYFDHEHGSDPRSYLGFGSSGMPSFGYTAAHAGISESHAGYKVYVSNDDLNGRAWMIVLNQDTGRPERASSQYHSLDWHISSFQGETLVDVRVMADFGQAQANCSSTVISHPKGESSAGSRVIPTTACAPQNAYEAWTASVNIGGAFRAAPYFDVDNPITAVDPEDMNAENLMCQYRSGAESCTGASPWSGNRRGVLRPGQLVRNSGSEIFYTDPFGHRVDNQELGAVRQFVTSQGWDTRQCCGPEVVFRIQTYSGGVYIAAPPEPSGSVEFGVWR